MAKPVEIDIRRFDKGITGNRDSAFHQHFDIFSDPSRLIPYRSTEADTATNVSSTDAKTYDIKDFRLGSDGKMYGLGKNGSSYPKVMRKTDPTTGNWLSSGSNNASTAEGEGNAARISGSFKEWQGFFWFFQGTVQVAKVAISGGAITNTVASVGSTIVTVADSVIGADDKMYMFYNNKVVRVSRTGAVTDDVLANLPSDMRIVSCCRYGSYIAIGMAYGTSATASPTGVSKVFIWDMVTSTTVNDVIDWGEGALMVLGNIEERLVGVSNKFLETPSGLTSLAIGQGAMVVRMWTGGPASVRAEIVANQNVTLGRFIRDVVIKDNRMSWVASVPFDASTSTESTYHMGIWTFGRKDANSDFALSLDYVEEGVDTANYKINSFGAAGNYWFISHSNDGSISKTNDAAVFTFTSIFETNRIGNEKQTLQLKAATVATDALPSGGQVVLKYKKDDEASFTTIFTHATANALRHTAINIETTGAALPTFKRIRFRVESTGNAVITGLRFLFDEFNDDVI